MGEFCGYTLTSDHDDADACSPAKLNGAHNLLTRRVQHPHAPHKGQVSLGSRNRVRVGGWGLSAFTQVSSEEVAVT